MNLLFRVLYAQKCTSTHHKLALDALRYLRGNSADEWAKLFLSEIQLYTDGAKAPDKKFKDFRNHVLHVSENFWGGAVNTAQTWYANYVDRLTAKDWPRAVYCAGVLSHYVTDPLMPLHTGQTEDEGQVHKFIEWGTAKAYEQLVTTHDAARVLQNWKPPSATESGTLWLEELIQSGATLANQYYDVLIDHYDPSESQKNPVAGFDDTSRRALSRVLAWSIKAIAFTLDQGIRDSAVSAPRKSLSVATVLSGISTPLFWITRNLSDAKDRKEVQAIWNELQATGRVVKTLPEDDRVVRKLHASEVLGIEEDDLTLIPIRKAGSLHERQNFATEKPATTSAKPSSPIQATAQTERSQPVSKPTTPLTIPATTPSMPVVAEADSQLTTTTPSSENEGAPGAESVSATESSVVTESEATTQQSAPENSQRTPADRSPRFYLELQSPVVNAPSIGPKTARRLNQIGIRTVQDLLEFSVTDAVDQLQQRWITTDVFESWQKQSLLMCSVPGLRGHDAQLLVGVEITTADAVRNCHPAELHAKVLAFSETPDGKSILRSSEPPDEEEIHRWITFASHASATDSKLTPKAA
ncbi:MAG: DUF4332 domain-containing protein [Planctomycetaceae bacterium]|nr:DUF4332 domain-containing protein [Planctomycetaceae bacterium]